MPEYPSKVDLIALAGHERNCAVYRAKETDPSLTYKVIGKKYGVCVERIRQMYCRAYNRQQMGYRSEMEKLYAPINDHEWRDIAKKFRKYGYA